MTPQKIIFLDIDGVLNSRDWYFHSYGSDHEKDLQADPRCIERLRTIVENTGARIVLSSSWRMFADYNKSLKELAEYPIDDDLMKITGVTPYLVQERGYRCYRGEEIETYLEDECKFQPQFYDMQKLKSHCIDIGFHNYLILDDDSDMLYNQRHNFICVPHEHGLTDAIVEDSIKLLNTPFWELDYHRDWKMYRQ